MIASLTVGNAGDHGAPFDGWFVGDLQAWMASRGLPAAEMPPAGLRATDALEVKWSSHAAAMPRPGGWADAAPVVTLSILISGEFRLAFRPSSEAEETVYLMGETGDYAIWGGDAEHTWSAVRDSVVLTVRWPERPKG